LQTRNLPEGIQRIIDNLVSPRLDWRELLRQTIESSYKTDYSYMRMNRKSQHIDAVLPGMTPGTQLNIAVAFDTSGSIREEMLKDFMSELRGIMEFFTEYQIHVFCFDTTIHNPQDFTHENMESIEDYRLAGFGGTLFEPIFDHLKDIELIPDQLVVFTDMEPARTWGDDNYCDVLWISHGSTKQAPFGTTVEYH
jgi:predicted metal-dependent peptidase